MVTRRLPYLGIQLVPLTGITLETDRGVVILFGIWGPLKYFLFDDFRRVSCQIFRMSSMLGIRYWKRLIEELMCMIGGVESRVNSSTVDENVI